jgi:hypothetical protein
VHDLSGNKNLSVTRSDIPGGGFNTVAAPALQAAYIAALSCSEWTLKSAMTPTSEKIIFAYGSRPAVIQTEHGQAPAIQFIQENGEVLSVVMSGEGMALVVELVGQFLADNPAWAATKAIKPQ